LQGGKLTSEGISPRQEKEAYKRRLRTCTEGQDLKARGEWIPQGGLMSPLENAHGGRMAEVHYGRLAEGIITAASMVMMDKTGWLSPISAARPTE
jgi:hypothetical protein